jgi:hypothetical protein
MLDQETARERALETAEELFQRTTATASQALTLFEMAPIASAA